jgi:Uma2 family endonuclease
MSIQQKILTVEDFDRFIALPENADRDFEFIAGDIVEVVSGNRSSELGMYVGSKLTVFVRERGLGRVTGADGGFMVAGERYIPDVAFISKAKQIKLTDVAYNPNPPDLAVEVLSPSDMPDKVRIKIANYLSVGTVRLAD